MNAVRRTAGLRNLHCRCRQIGMGVDDPSGADAVQPGADGEFVFPVVRFFNSIVVQNGGCIAGCRPG